MTAKTFTDDHYNTLYADQQNELYEIARQASYGESWGQAGWSNLDEIDWLIDQLPLNAETYLLDYACGAGGASIRAAVRTGCRVDGFDISEQGIRNAKISAETHNLTQQTRYRVVDAAAPSILDADTYDVLICLDAITDMPDRPRLLAEFMRVLKPGGVAYYIDCLVIAGQLTGAELNIRSGTGYNVYTPPGLNEQMISAAGFELLRADDLTEGLATVADGWVQARDQHSAEFIAIEGQLRFDQDQTFHRLAVKLARERRLLRTGFLIQKPN